MNTEITSTALGVILSGLLAMVLIYLVTAFLPKIAAAVDRLLGREKKETPPIKAEEYEVCDIYEGEKQSDKPDN